MRVLVTGATGFVGGHLLEHLVASGDQPFGVSRSGAWPKLLAHLAPLVRLEPLDLVEVSDQTLCRLLEREQPQAIYHLAAQSNPQQSMVHPRDTWAQNLGGTLSLLEAVRSSGVKSRVVLVGSGVCYGNPAPEYMPVREDCPVRPTNPYAASKAAADLMGIQHFLAHGTETVMARPFNHSGPRQSARYVLASLARQVAEVESGARPAVEHGNLAIVRDFTDVRDIVRAYRLLALKGTPGQIYNIGTSRDIDLARMLEILISQARTAIPTRADASRMRANDQARLLADASLLRRDTGWAPVFSIEATLSDMLQYWRENPGAD